MALAPALAALLAFAPGPRDPWSWTAPPQCPGSDAVREAVEGHLGRPLSERATPWSVVGAITHDEDGYAVALVIETPDGRHDRLLTEPRSCQTLSDSAALLIAMALSADPQMPEALRPEPEPQPEPEPLDVLDEPVTPAPPRAEDLTFALGVAPGLDWGTLRTVSPGSMVTFAWQPRRLRVGVAAHFGGNPAFTLPPLAARIRLWRWALAAEVGPVPTLKRFEFPILFGVEAGQVVLTPRVLLPDGSQAAWVALRVIPGVAFVPRRWIALTARIGTTLALTRPTFAISGLDPILRPSRVGLRAYLGVEFRIPLVMKTLGRGNQPPSR